MIKDLACPDRPAKQRLSRSQRLRFYLDYVQKPRLTGEDSARIGEIAQFFDGRAQLPWAGDRAHR